MACGTPIFRLGVSALFAAAMSLDAAAHVAEGVKAVLEDIRANSIDRTTRCRYYKAWYAEQCSRAELSAIRERNIAAHRRWIELMPDSQNPHASLGSVYAAMDMWDEAKKELLIAHSASNRIDFTLRVQSGWDLANCYWQAGDRVNAMRMIAETANLKRNGDTPEAWWKAKYLNVMLNNPDGDLDAYTLPHSVDSRPFPTPQKAEYGDTRVSLAKVELTVSTGRPDDPIVRLLKRKLQRFGSKFEKGGTPVVIEISPDAPVAKPQGYSLDVAPGSVRVRARTRLGALWGVVSLIQCIDRGGERVAVQDGKPSIRTLRIKDWPRMTRRGVIDNFQPWFFEPALFGKMNSVTIHIDDNYWLSPLDRELYRIWGERFRAFGIEAYCVIRDKAMNPILPLSSSRTWKLHLAWTRFIASCGMGMSFHLDDDRFPLHPDDLKTAGSGANIDAKYMTRLYRAVKKDHPGFKMQFCPPFYWGPNSPASYPEKRDVYLRSLGADLDPEIDVYWTGGSVKSDSFTAEKVKWFADMIGRGPTVFHNGNCIGQHNYIQFGADPTGYRRSHSPEIFDHLASFQHNMSSMSEMSEVYSAMDWVWNPDAHDSTNSVLRALDMLEGAGVADIISRATPSLSYFDTYEYGKPRGELFAEDQADLDRRVAEADAALAKAMALAKNGGTFFNGFARGLEWAKNLAEIKRNPPEWFLKKHEAEMANNSWARDEVAYDEKNGDQFIPSEMLSGAIYFDNITDWSHGRRTVRYVNPGVEVRGSFECNSYPPPAPYRMLVVGMGFSGDAATVEVELNGRSLWRGEAFMHDRFSPLEVAMPVEDMRMGVNRFAIRNVSPEGKATRKAILHYIVVRK